MEPFAIFMTLSAIGLGLALFGDSGDDDDTDISPAPETEVAPDITFDDSHDQPDDGNLEGTAEDDILSGNAAANGLTGTDTTTPDDRIIGSLGDDTIYGGVGNDILSGSEDHQETQRVTEASLDGDTLYGGDSQTASDDDVIYGGDGEDSLYGDIGDDALFGENSDDQIQGEDGDDTLYGGAGSDVLIGAEYLIGRGNDVIFGGAGNDYISLGTGLNAANGAQMDYAEGGSGSDIYFIAPRHTAVETPPATLTAARNSTNFIADFDVTTDLLDMSEIYLNVQQAINSAVALPSGDGVFFKDLNLTVAGISLLDIEDIVILQPDIG